MRFNIDFRLGEGLRPGHLRFDVREVTSILQGTERKMISKNPR